MTNKGKWLPSEDSILVEQVKANPQNLNACFIAAARATGRTKGACSNRWYTHLSKDPNNACFVTVSGRHKSLNRKNGQGENSTISIFKRLLRLLGWS